MEGWAGLAGALYAHFTDKGRSFLGVSPIMIFCQSDTNVTLKYSCATQMSLPLALHSEICSSASDIPPGHIDLTHTGQGPSFTSVVLSSGTCDSDVIVQCESCGKKYKNVGKVRTIASSTKGAAASRANVSLFFWL